MLKPSRELYTQQEFEAAQDPNDRHLMEIHNARARRLRGVRFRRESAVKKGRNFSRKIEAALRDYQRVAVIGSALAGVK